MDSEWTKVHRNELGQGEIQANQRAKELHNKASVYSGTLSTRFKTGENRGERTKNQVIKIKKLHQAQLK